MRRNELDYILGTMLDAHKDVSDLILTVNKPLQIEASGDLTPVPVSPNIEKLTPFQTETIAMNLLNNSHRLSEDLLRTVSWCCSYSSPTGLRAPLTQPPMATLVGEMRDRAPAEIALSAAEPGHWVLSALHPIDAGQTINRILGMFETEEQAQARYRLSDTLRWVIS